MVLGAPLMLGYFCDNIGPEVACLPSGTTGVTGSLSCYMTQPSGIPILSCVLFMQIGDPYCSSLIRRIFDLLVNNISVDRRHLTTAILLI